MASFQEHIAQANRNLDFLEQANQSLNTFWDWQVTAAFYVCVHLVNAHLAQKSGLSLEYGVKLKAITVKCIELKQGSLQNIAIR